MPLPPSGSILVKKVDGNENFIEDVLSSDDLQPLIGEGFVLTTGTQTISGNKTFTDQTIFLTSGISLPANSPMVLIRGSENFTRFGIEGTTPVFQGWKFNGTVDSKTIVTSGNNLALFQGGGWNGSDFAPVTGRMSVRADADWSAGTSYPTRLDFETTPTGSTTPSIRWRINSEGHLSPITSGTLNIGSNETPMSILYCDGAILLKGILGTIRQTTSDGADNNQVTIGGGGGLLTTRGAVLTLKGNEQTTSGGSAILQCGDIAGAAVRLATFGDQSIYFSTSGFDRAIVSSSGQVSILTSGTGLAAGNPVLLIQGSENNTRLQVEGTTPVVQGAGFNGTLASKTASVNTNNLLILQAGGYDATTPAQTTAQARITMRAAGTFSDTSRPTELAFFTTAISSTTITERMLLANDGSLLLKSHTGYIGSGDYKITKAVNTTDATTTTLFSETLTDNTTYKYEVQITGRFNSTTAKGVIGRLSFGVYRNNAGSATIIGTRIRESDTYGSSGYTFDVDVSSNDVRIRVTGATSETVSWTASITRIAVSTSS